MNHPCHVFVVVACVFVSLSAVAANPKKGAGSQAPHNSPGHELAPLDAHACAGSVMSPPKGLKEVKDASFNATPPLDKTDNGKLCKAKVFEVVSPVTVYRVWNKSKAYTEKGQWWSFSRPKGPVSQYRHDNEICPEWSDLDMLTQCKLKVGSKIAVGPGQSAKCATLTYPKSAVNQVFVPNDGRKGVFHVDNCSKPVAWP